MRLVGKALAAQIPASTTGNGARLAFGAMTRGLAGAYQTLDDYGPGALGVVVPAVELAYWATDGAASVGAARSYLDSTNGLLQGYFAHMPADDLPLSDQQLAELRTAASTSSVAVKTVDDLFSTSWLDGMVDELIAAVATVSGKIAAAVAKVAGSFLGGTWYLWLAGGLVLYAYKRGRGWVSS